MTIDHRFYIDHGMIHDRETGKHVTTSPDDEVWQGGTITSTCELLNELSRRPTAPSQEGEAIEQGNHDCLAKRRPGEPMFILLGRDPDAHNIVRSWAERRLAAGGDPAHCAMGLETAFRMKEYAADPANAPKSAPPAAAYPVTAKPVDGEVVERLTKARDRLIPLGQSGEDYIWRPAKEAVQAINALLLLVAALPLGGEGMADLSKTDRLSGSLIPNDGWQDIATAPKDWSDVLLGWVGAEVIVGYWNTTCGYWDWQDSHAPQEVQPTHWMPLPAAPTQGTTPPPSADKSGDA